MVTQHYKISGMSCEHCVRAVNEEIQQIPEIDRYEVDLDTATLTVHVDGQVPDDKIRDAIDEAGFEIVS